MPILAQQFPVFQRAMRIIQNITQGYPAIVTTTFAHQYITGMIARVNIAPGYGMQQINQLYSDITVIDTTTFSINIDTTHFEPFSTPTAYLQARQYCQVTPVGEINSILTAATKNVLPYSAS
jgi:hypothetical protein